jgi:hypothetical protein
MDPIRAFRYALSGVLHAPERPRRRLLCQERQANLRLSAGVGAGVERPAAVLICVVGAAGELKAAIEAFSDDHISIARFAFQSGATPNGAPAWYFVTKLSKIGVPGLAGSQIVA